MLNIKILRLTSLNVIISEFRPKSIKTYAHTENEDERSLSVAGMMKDWPSYFQIITFVAWMCFIWRGLLEN